MGYAVLADLDKQLSTDDLIQLTDDENNGTVNTTRVSNALADADTEIDGYLGSRYPLPLASPPPILNKLAVDITIYNLYGRRGGPPEHVEKRYTNAVRFLERLAEGKISLGSEDPEGTGSGDTAQVSSGQDRTFNRTTLENF